MSMAIKLATFMFALNIATIWVNTMGIFQVRDPDIVWSASGYENWRDALPSGEGAESANQVADYFKLGAQFLIGGMVMLITMVWNFIFGIAGFAVKVGLGNHEYSFLPATLQLVAWWSYRMALIEMKSGRNIKEMY